MLGVVDRGNLSCRIHCANFFWCGACSRFAQGSFSNEKGPFLVVRREGRQASPTGGLRLTGWGCICPAPMPSLPHLRHLGVGLAVLEIDRRPDALGADF